MKTGGDQLQVSEVDNCLESSIVVDLGKYPSLVRHECGLQSTSEVT